MTVRAVVLGLLGALFIACAGYINDFVLKLTYLIGNHFPIFIFGGLVLFLLLVNPLLRLIRIDFSIKEMATIVILMLSTACIPSSGLLRTFTITLAMPAQLTEQNVAWGPKRNNLLAYVPDKLLASKVVDSRVVGPFIQGMKSSDADKIDIHQIPWAMQPDPQHEGAVTGWSRPLGFWVPLIALTFLGLLGLAAVVHRQWSSNELLRYPIAEFASEIMEQEKGRLFAKVFYNRLFWGGVIAALAVHLVNGYWVWNNKSIQIPVNIDMGVRCGSCGPTWRSPARPGRHEPAAVDHGGGVQLPAVQRGGAEPGHLQFPVLRHRGRLHQLRRGHQRELLHRRPVQLPALRQLPGRGADGAVRRTQLLRGRGEAAAGAARQAIPPYSVWGARIFLGCMIAAVAWLTTIGLDVYLAVIVMLMITLMLLVVGRINAETGLFFIQPGWPIIGCMLGMFGSHALGPQMLLILGLVVTVLAADPRESIMPFILNGLKLSERSGVRPSRAMPWMSTALIAGLALGVPFVLWRSTTGASTSPRTTG